MSKRQLLFFPPELENAIHEIVRLDNRKWSQPSSYNPSSNSEQKILTHWLIYITDRVKKLDRKDPKTGKIIHVIWDGWYNVILDWAKVSLNGNKIAFTSTEATVSINGKKIYLFMNERFHDLNGNTFKSRYPNDDYAVMKRTINLLNNYDHSLVKFIFKQLETFYDDTPDTELVKKIACSLFLLTYASEKKVDEQSAINYFNNKDAFSKYYKKWCKESAYGKKRLWAAFRDFIKDYPLQADLISTANKMNIDPKYIQKWVSFKKEFKFLNQLELPGDVWNNNPDVAAKVLAPLALELGIPFQIQNVTEVVRKIADVINEKDKSNNGSGEVIYPEQFDITFDDKSRNELLAPFKKKQVKINFFNIP